MYTRFKSYSWRLIVVFVLALAFFQLNAPPQVAAGDIKLVIDGESIETSPQPVIQNSRTMVPVRLVSEKLGAQVEWNEQNRTVRIVRGNRSVLLRIDSHLVEYNTGERVFNLSDVPPQIIEDRTFVPLRLVSNALGVAIRWEDASRTVYIDSAQAASITPFFDMKISSVQPGQVITETTDLQASFPGSVPAGAAEIKFLLINPETGRGTVVARGSGMTAKYRWLPDLQESGQRVLVAAVYNGDGRFLAGDAVPVQVAVVPRVSLTGLVQGQVVGDTVSLGADLNFVAAYVKYEVVNQDKGKVFVTEESDPQGVYKWAPMLEDNGNVSFKVIAYDHAGQAYAGEAVTVKVDAARKLELRGVSAGSTVEKPVTLSVFRNFQVSQTEYVIKDPQTGKEEVLAQVGYTSYRWFPGPELTGTRELLVRVKDTSGVTHTSSSVSVKLTGAPKLILGGVGPQQVVTGPLKLTASSNVALDSIQYILVNPKTGARRVIAGGKDAGAEYTWTPVQGDDGEWKMQAEGTLASGEKITSEAIAFKVYLGTIYSAKPVVEKSAFLDLASGLASQSWQKTGMSAALQTAQAILETGWGQSVPVDKYTGKFSYNLFGIKGTGPAGSVVSNTWEEYNGQTFRVDANFRAYSGV
ncbi:MAG: glucosaminidase domain-containing protein, partial [Firmicutes bacterium]|nr:glucosaminidase domain-containing protein [Bacillota bacterium]